MPEPSKVKGAVGTRNPDTERARKPYVKPEITVKRKGMNDTAKERLAQKGDIDSGMTAEQKRKVYEIETRQADNYNEHAVAVDDRGKVVGESVVDTHKSSGWIIPPIGPYVRTHNHPDIEADTNQQVKKIMKKSGKEQKEYVRSIAGNIGIPLSSADIRNTIAWGNKEVRARTGNFVFSMRNTDKGVNNPDPQLGEKIARDWKRIYKQYSKSHDDHVDRVMNEFYSNPNEENARNVITLQSRLNTMTAHAANKYIAKKYGLVYTRKRVRDNQ